MASVPKQRLRGRQRGHAPRCGGLQYRPLRQVLQRLQPGQHLHPPGWDRWFAAGAFRYFDYDANDQGTIRHFGTSEDDYHTDVLSRMTNTFISDSTKLGTQNWSYVPDGRSLRPVLEGNASSWRGAVLLEAHQGPWTYAAATSSGIRTVGTSKQKYIEYEGGAREFYNLGVEADPYELTNKYPAAKPAGLASRLRALKTCKAAACAAAEDGP
jgi:hypothetical protein